MKKLALALALIVVLLAGCGGRGTAQRKQDQAIVDSYSQQLSKAVPYPLSQMKDSTERRNLRERLLRFNKPDKVGYVYLLSFGKFLGYYTIEGKISSTQSQMTVTDEVRKYCHSGCREVTQSMGDDGSYGPNEEGVFFFTTGGVMVQTDLDYVYSDAPLNVGDVPQLLK